MKDIDASTKIDDDSDEPLLPAEHNPPRHNILQYYGFFVISSLLLLISCIILYLTALDTLTSRPSNTHCQTPTVRLEWRSLSLEARENYITAIQCLSKRPSRLGLNTTRYDDFVYSHLNVSGDTHDAPILLPWHRLYVQRYEDALRSECDYEDPLPYWDWTLDTSNPAHSPVWSSRFGLGGNGTEPKNCLTDGPLASMKPQYPEPHCLRRNFTGENMHAAEYTSAIIEDIISNASTYHDFRLRLERGPHRFVHVGIGGEMPTLWSSNDPIFFLHHAQLDRLWWRWQHQGYNDQIRGYDSIDGNLGTPDPEAAISMDEILVFSGLGDDLTAGDVVSTQTSILCYKYE